jgi:hypothetical protein
MKKRKKIMDKKEPNNGKPIQVVRKRDAVPNPSGFVTRSLCLELTMHPLSPPEPIERPEQRNKP